MEKFNLKFTSSGYEFSLNHTAFFFNEENHVLFTSVQMLQHSSAQEKPFESTVKTVRSQRIEIQLESENCV